jgi:hypothetical protein
LNVDWQGKPKFSEKTCPSATFVHHKIPHDQTRVWIQAAAVGRKTLFELSENLHSKDTERKHIYMRVMTDISTAELR